MPLTKNKTAQEANPPVGPSGSPHTPNPPTTRLTGVHEGELKAEVSQLTSTRKTAAPMTKDDYWRNREERDIDKDKHIRLSGILQALLGSVNFGQYCTVASKEAYLEDIKTASLELAKFVTEKA